MKRCEQGQVLINALPGQVGPGTHMDGFATNRDLTASDEKIRRSGLSRCLAVLMNVARRQLCCVPDSFPLMGGSAVSEWYSSAVRLVKSSSTITQG
jgi:hypothetical protein